MAPLDAATLASYLLLNPRTKDPGHPVAAVAQRQRLIALWDLPKGANVLEIGCGQGDCTVALANAVGEEGHVTGIDPADLEWGTPPYGLARNYIKDGPLGKRCTFVKATVEEYLLSTTETFDYIVLAHCIWYFADPGHLDRILQLARLHGRHLLIGEYALTSSFQEAAPHILTALTVNMLESQRGEDSLRNIRCIMTPSQITSIASKNSWTMIRETTFIPAIEQKDAQREVRMLLNNDEFEKDLEKQDSVPKVKLAMSAFKDAVRNSVSRLPEGINSVRNMDVWAASFQAA